MQTGISLQELARKITAQQELKHDLLADTRALRLSVQDDRVMSLLCAEGDYPILSLAHDQIGSRLGIPAKYYDRMRAEDPDLLALNVNTWFDRSPEKRMVRTLGGDCRAFLSDRYSRIENEEIAAVALPVLERIPDVQIVSCEVTDKRLYIQAVSPRVQGEVKKDDIVQAGVVIRNSEVGLGSCSVSALDYRLWCLNGAISEELARAYHVGRRIEDNAELWSDEARKADDRAVLLKLRDMVTAAVDATRFSKRIERMKGLTEITVKGDPTKAVEVLAKKVGASEFEKGGILRSLIEGSDLSAWGMLNAVTAQAHTAKSYDRGVELEASGGALLALNRNEWREIMEAA